MVDKAWVTVVGGSDRAKQRWPARTYQHKRSAKRRMRQIHNARDMGVVTIWILTVKDPQQ